MTQYYDCTSNKGTVRIEGSKENLAAFLAKADPTKPVRISSSDSSFELTTRGAMIDTCNNVAMLRELQPIITQMQFGIIPTPEIKRYAAQGNDLSAENRRGR